MYKLPTLRYDSTNDTAGGTRTMLSLLDNLKILALTAIGIIAVYGLNQLLAA